MKTKADLFLEAIAGVTVPGKDRPPGVKAKKKAGKKVAGAAAPKQHRKRAQRHRKRGESVHKYGQPVHVGSRGLGGIIAEVKVPDAKADMKGYGRDPGKYPRLRLAQLESAPVPVLKSYTFKGVVQGETSNYRTYVQFQDVRFCEEESKDCPDLDNVEGAAVWYRKPSLKENPARFFCECEDFKFVWSYPLFKSDGLMGNFKSFKESPFHYERKPNSTAPGRNPEGRLGFCKHVNSMLLALRDSRRISP